MDSHQEIMKQIAKHLRDVHFGGNWTWVNLKDTLTDVTWQQATTKLHGFNTIAALVFHTNYFIRSAVLPVLQARPLDAHDKFSWDATPIQSKEDWDTLVRQSLEDAEATARIIETLPESILAQDFTHPKYGNYYRNFHGLIEHMHYHLGQITIIKKLVQRAEASQV